MVRRVRPDFRRRSDILMAVDTAVHAVNDLAFSGIAMSSQSVDLCEDRPIAWLELRRQMFRPRTLTWSVVTIESILILIIYWGHGMGVPPGNFILVWRILEVVLWIATIAIVSTYSASLFPLERIQQTMSVLLVTPLTFREIVEQKVAGIRRMTLALSIPLLTMWLERIGPYSALESSSGRRSGTVAWYCLGLELLSLAAFPWFAVWLGVYCGLRIRTRTYAILGTLGIIAITWSLPWILYWLTLSDWIRFCPLVPLSPDISWAPNSAEEFRLPLVLRSIAVMMAIVGIRAATYRQFSKLAGWLEAA